MPPLSLVLAPSSSDEIGRLTPAATSLLAMNWSTEIFTTPWP
jgi:hypothetical protein